MHEDSAILKRKVERLKKIEMASDMDEILKEEIREYKETLTCPSCKVKRKDAILTKCFHVFCYDCLRSVFKMLYLCEYYHDKIFQDTLRDKTEKVSQMQCCLWSLRLPSIVFIINFCLCCTNVLMLLVHYSVWLSLVASTSTGAHEVTLSVSVWYF